MKDPQAKIDLGGIAKGFIADEMRSFLNKKGITSGVISLGGNVLTLGKRQITLPIPLVSKTIFRNRYVTWHLKRIRCFGCFFRYL